MDSAAQSFPNDLSRGSHSADDLRTKISQISEEFQLDLPWPSGATKPKPAKTLEEKIVASIKPLYWKKDSSLEDCLTALRQFIGQPPIKNTPEALCCFLRDKPPYTAAQRFISETGSYPVDVDRFPSRWSFSSPATSFTSGSSFSGADKPTCSAPAAASSITANAITTPNAGLPLSDHRTVLENYRLKSLPEAGLQQEVLPEHLLCAPVQVRFECIRVAHSCKQLLDLQTLANAYKHEWKDYKVFWESVKKLLPNGYQLPSTGSPSAWKSENAQSLHLSGKLVYASELKMFELQLDPLNILPEGRTCRFFYHFDANRFMRLRVPNPSYASPYTTGNDSNRLRERLTEWAVKPMQLAGNSWRVFYMKPGKSSKGESKKNKGESVRQIELFLFATEGTGIKTISLFEMLHWFLPFDLNYEKPAQKAFARIELGLSKTFKTHTFLPSQIRQVQDKLADGSFCDSSLNEGGKRFQERCEMNEVMNDGCSRMSPAAMEKIWANIPNEGPCPSAFQGRIGPWKGMWSVAHRSAVSDRDEIWIEVTPSQKKFTPQEEQFLGLQNFDPQQVDLDRLTFEALAWSTKPASNQLYKAFLPIMNECGVNKAELEEFVNKSLNLEKENFLSALESSHNLYVWIQSKDYVSEEVSEVKPASAIPDDVVPKTAAAKILMMLDSGYNMKNSKYFAESVSSFARGYLQRLAQDFAIPIAKSTYLLGIADELGVLEPHEIHVNFSGEVSNELSQQLDDVEVLAARHPALRSSDMQKVRAVFKPELAHLRDVVVYSTRGWMSMAGKLQGGDYDGDKFWLCAEPSIVKNFRNKPQPSSMLSLKELGISQDNTTVGEIFARLNGIDCWQALDEFLARCFSAALKPNLLGEVTNLHKKVCYEQNATESREINALTDAHGYVIDSSKNGYSFDHKALNKFQKHNTSKSAKWWSDVRDIEVAYDVTNKRPTRWKSDHIIDHLIFEVAYPAVDNITKEIQLKCMQYIPLDTKISTLYKETKHSCGKFALECLKNFKKRLERIQRNLREKFTQVKNLNLPDRERLSREKKIMETTREAFEALQPAVSMCSDDAEVRSWLLRTLPNQPTAWDLLKASALYALYEESGGHKFAWNCAFLDLCWIMAHSDQERPRAVVSNIRSRMKMRKVKRPRIEYKTEESTEFDTDTDMDYDILTTAGFDLEYAGPKRKAVITDGANDVESDEDSDDSFHEALQSASQDLEAFVLVSPRKRKSLP